jgi:hypothetical protein
MNTIFVDKNLHFAESGGTGEGNQIVLKLEPVWWPKTFQLQKRRENDSWRWEAATLLQRVSEPPDQLVADLIAAAAPLDGGPDQWLGHMFLAAMWTLDAKVVEDFLDGLRNRQITEGFDQTALYKFEAIGEVQFLRQRLAGIQSTAEIIRREHRPIPWSIGACATR